MLFSVRLVTRQPYAMPYEVWQGIIHQQLLAVKVQRDQGTLRSIYRETGSAVLAIYDAADAQAVDLLLAGMPVFPFTEQVTVRALWDFAPALLAYANPAPAPVPLAGHPDVRNDTTVPIAALEERRADAINNLAEPAMAAPAAAPAEDEKDGLAAAGMPSTIDSFEEDAVRRLQRIENLLSRLVPQEDDSPVLLLAEEVRDEPIERPHAGR